jgi:hypothetical protein
VCEYKKENTQFIRNLDLQLSRNQCVKEEELRYMTFDTAVMTMEGIQFSFRLGFSN